MGTVLSAHPVVYCQLLSSLAFSLSRRRGTHQVRPEIRRFLRAATDYLNAVERLACVQVGRRGLPHGLPENKEGVYEHTSVAIDAGRCGGSLWLRLPISQLVRPTGGRCPLSVVLLAVPHSALYLARLFRGNRADHQPRRTRAASLDRCRHKAQGRFRSRRRALHLGFARIDSVLEASFSIHCVGSSCTYTPSALAPLGGLYSLLLALLTAAIWSQYLEGGFASAFDFRAIFRRAVLHPGMTVLVWLMAIVAGIIGGLGVIMVVIGLFFTLPYAFAVTANLYGQFSQRTQRAATAD